MFWTLFCLSAGATIYKYRTKIGAFVGGIINDMEEKFKMD